MWPNARSLCQWSWLRNAKLRTQGKAKLRNRIYLKRKTNGRNERCISQAQRSFSSWELLSVLCLYLVPSLWEKVHSLHFYKICVRSFIFNPMLNVYLGISKLLKNCCMSSLSFKSLLAKPGQRVQQSVPALKTAMFGI